MNKCLVLVFCLVSMLKAVSGIEGCMQFRFDYPYSQQAGGWLKFHRVPATFTEAFLRCKAEGALLASPLTMELRQAMAALFKNSSTARAIFTGIHATFSKGDFSSVEGVPLMRIPVEWGPDEPDNNGGVEACTIMVQNGTLADVNCNDIYPYICYKKKTQSSVLPACGTVDKEYNYDARTGSCYKFHRIGRNWRRAYMTCMAEGGHLAIINSAVEAQVIKDIFAENPTSSILAAHKEVALIGTYTSPDYDLWFTIHGDTLVEAGYSTFNSGEPKNEGTYCGAVFRNGLLDDFYCHITLPFICEKRSLQGASLVIDDEDIQK